MTKSFLTSLLILKLNYFTKAVYHLRTVHLNFINFFLYAKKYLFVYLSVIQQNL